MKRIPVAALAAFTLVGSLVSAAPAQAMGSIFAVTFDTDEAFAFTGQFGSWFPTSPQMQGPPFSKAGPATAMFIASDVQKQYPDENHVTFTGQSTGAVVRVVMTPAYAVGRWDSATYTTVLEQVPASVTCEAAPADRFACAVSGQSVTVTAKAPVTAVRMPVIGLAPSAETVVPYAQRIQLTAKARGGSGDVAYTWYRLKYKSHSWTAVGWAATYTGGLATKSGDLYKVRVSNSVGWVESAPTHLAVSRTDFSVNEPGYAPLTLLNRTTETLTIVNDSSTRELPSTSYRVVLAPQELVRSSWHYVNQTPNGTWFTMAIGDSGWELQVRYRDEVSCQFRKTGQPDSFFDMSRPWPNRPFDCIAAGGGSSVKKRTADTDSMLTLVPRAPAVVEPYKMEVHNCAGSAGPGSQCPRN